MFLFKSKLLNNNVRDYTDVETPCSISNQEAKHIVGDDTTPYWQGESSSLRTLFFLFLKIQIDYMEGLNLMFDLHNCTSVKLEQATLKVFFRVINSFISSKNMQIKDIL